MIRNASFKPELTLEKLQAQFNRFEALWGTLTEIGNQDGKTIGVYDSSTNGTRKIVLKPGPAAPQSDVMVVSTGTVFIIGQLQKVTAYRAA